MEKLPRILCPEVVIKLDDAVIQNIAAETDESQAERHSSSKKLEVLEAALETLHHLDRHKPKST